MEAINYIRNISKKKVVIDKIVIYLNNAGTSNWEKESVEVNLKEMQTKGINAFYATFSFYTPPETLESLWLSDDFRGYRKRPVARNRLIMTIISL